MSQLSKQFNFKNLRKMHSEENGAEVFEWIGVVAVVAILLISASSVFETRGSEVGVAFVSQVEKWINLEFGGGSAANPTLGGTSEVGSSGNPVQEDGGFLSSTLSALQYVGEQGVGFVKGFVNGAADTVTGLATLAVDAVKLSPITALIAPETYQATLDKYAQIVEAIRNDPSGVAQEIFRPLVDAWNEGRYGELAGAATFEVVSTIFLAPAKVGKLGLIAKLEKALPDELVRIVLKAERLTPDELAALRRRLDDMSPDELADLRRQLDGLTPDELAQRGLSQDDLRRLGLLCSFSADTLVSTVSGLQPIASIGINDRVLAYDEQSATIDYYPVLGAWSHLDPQIVHLTVDGEQIETTPEHPFYANGMWVPAGDLWVGATIMDADNQVGVVEAVTIVAQPQVMYNLTVDVAHTYFVGQGQWLVHNACLKTLSQAYTFNRGSRNFKLVQGDSKSGWTHIWERHIDPNPQTPSFVGKSKFDSSWTEKDVTEALEKTLRHGKESDFYGQSVFEYRMNHNNSGYRRYRVTVNPDGTVQTFHPLD